jgi:RNA recognition motif-containing protein
MPKDYHTKLPRGIAFVQFEDPRDAADSLVLDRTLMGGREVSVQYAEHGRKRPDQMAQTDGGRGRGGFGGGRGGYGGGGGYGPPAGRGYGGGYGGYGGGGYGGGGYGGGGYGGGGGERRRSRSRSRGRSRSRSRSRSRR